MCGACAVHVRLLCGMLPGILVSAQKPDSAALLDDSVTTNIARFPADETTIVPKPNPSGTLRTPICKEI